MDEECINDRTWFLRVQATKFRKSIPLNMSIKLPDDLVDILSDDDIPEFYALLEARGLVKVGNYWEKR